MLAVVALKQPAIDCLILCLTRGCIELPLAIVTLANIRLEDSSTTLEQKQPSLWTCGQAWR